MKLKFPYCHSHFFSHSKISFLFCLTLLVLSSCQTENKEGVKTNTIERVGPAVNQNPVEIEVLTTSDFDNEILSNGRLTAKKRIELKFNVDGVLDKINVSEGQYVRNNQALARIETYKFSQNLKSANIKFQKAKLEFEDILVGRGFDLNIKDSIPKNILSMAKLRSGYSEAQQEVEIARHNLKETTLYAPFSGNIANLESRLNEQVSSSTEVLTIIDDSEFEVKFNIIESERSEVKEDLKISVTVFVDSEEFIGKIHTINPVVDENGTIQVTAIIKNKNNILIDGMNVKIRIHNKIPNMLVVSKEAILDRQNQKVLFKYEQGKAKWVYVNTLYENSKYYAIDNTTERASSSLKEGDSIIVKGNLNLAHESLVQLID